MKKLHLPLIALGFLLTKFPAMAASDVNFSISKPSIVQIQEPGKLLGGLIALIFMIAVIASFIFLVWGGVQWIISGGDKAGVEAAQHRIQAALLGLFIVFVSWAIFSIVGSFLGFSITDLKITTPF